MAIQDINRYGGASHFAHDSAYEIQRQNHWEVDIDLEALGLDADLASKIRMTCQNISVPNYKVDATPVKHANDTVWIATNPTFNNSFTINVYDTVSYDMQEALMKWYSRVYNPQTKLMGLVKNYKTTASLFMYSPDCSVIREWRLYGMFITGFKVDDLSYDQGGLVKCSCEFSVDNAIRVQTRTQEEGTGFNGFNERDAVNTAMN